MAEATRQRGAQRGFLGKNSELKSLRFLARRFARRSGNPRAFVCWKAMYTATSANPIPLNLVNHVFLLSK